MPGTQCRPLLTAQANHQTAWQLDLDLDRLLQPSGHKLLMCWGEVCSSPQEQWRLAGHRPRLGRVVSCVRALCSRHGCQGCVCCEWVWLPPRHQLAPGVAMPSACAGVTPCCPPAGCCCSCCWCSLRTLLMPLMWTDTASSFSAAAMACSMRK